MGVMDCTFPPDLLRRNMCCHGPLHDRSTPPQDEPAPTRQLVDRDGLIPLGMQTLEPFPAKLARVMRFIYFFLAIKIVVLQSRKKEIRNHAQRIFRCITGNL